MNENTVQSNEMGRAIRVADLDLDYSDTHEAFKDLTKLAAKIAGTEIAMVHLIDLHTLWTVSHFGAPIYHVPKEESISQFAMVCSDAYMEIKDLSADERFKEKEYIKGDPKLRYYLGLPLQTEDGYRLGILCLLSVQTNEMSPEKIEMLQMVGDETVRRLADIKMMQDMRNIIKHSRETHKKVAHDIRGPLSGIVNLAHIIAQQGHDTKIEEVLEVVNMIHSSGNSLLEFAEEILLQKDSTGLQLESHEINLLLLKDKLLKLYAPQALHKQVTLSVETHPDAAIHVPFSKNKLLQITGNLISNAIKFTPNGGDINVNLHMIERPSINNLVITVTDTGVGLAEDQINYILKGTPNSTHGTGGEQGYGFGLSLVKHLVSSMNGNIDIRSGIGKGTCFELMLPLNKL